MATIHPSRAGLVPRSDAEAQARPSTSSGAGASSVNEAREEELRQKLQQARNSRGGRGAEQSRGSDEREAGRRRSSPTYEAYSARADDRGHDEQGSGQRAWREQRPQPRWRPDARFEGRDLPPHMRWNGDRLAESEDGRPLPGAWGRRGEAQRDNEGRGHALAAFAQPNGAPGFTEGRQEQRKASNVSIWPPSPTSPYRSGEECEKTSRHYKDSSRLHSSKRHHRSHRRRSSDDEEDIRRRSEDEEGRARSHHQRRDRSSKRDRTASPERSRRSADKGSDEDEEERKRRRRRRKEKGRAREDGDRRERHRLSRRRDDDDGRSERRASEHHRRSKVNDTEQSTSAREANTSADDVLSASAIAVRAGQEASTGSAVRRIGPQLPPKADSEDGSKSGPTDMRAYGKALLPGEGSAMANFVQDGKRIPRRGEIGLSSEQIEKFEGAGYVMSGSRHHRMNAVRMRKENQVYTAEENRSILKMIAEEKQKKEAVLVEQFKEMVDSMGGD